jgi:hypothetical protein
MLGDEFTREINGKTQIHTRQSVIMRLISHDAFHSGEISEILGMHRLPEIDLWRPSPPKTAAAASSDPAADSQTDRFGQN